MEALENFLFIKIKELIKSGALNLNNNNNNNNRYRTLEEHFTSNKRWKHKQYLITNKNVTENEY